MPKTKKQKLPTPAQLRRFARDKGMHVGERGRIPADVIEAFQKAIARGPIKYAKYLEA